MPRVIGWDIGIKNLSYCIFDSIQQNESGNEYNEYFEFGENRYYLVDWQVINLIPKLERKENEIILSDRQIPDSCCYITVNKKGVERKCNSKVKVACWSKENDKEISYYCVKHKKAMSDITQSKVFSEINNKCCDCMIDNCTTTAVYVRRDNAYLGYCRKHTNELVKASELSIEADLFKITRQKKADKNDLTILSEALYRELAQYPQILDADCVLFENQPVLKNPTMKSMQIFLYGYYVMNGYMKDDKAVSEIHCYNANKKIEMQYFVAEEDLQGINNEISHLKSKYSQTKKKGIALVEYFFANNYTNMFLDSDDNTLGMTNNARIQIFDDKKKRDDLADSFLMTLHYLEKKEIVKLKKHAL